MTTKIHDVLIIGAGPAGLAVAARLREPTPSSIFTDAEHDRYHWIKKHSGRMNLRPRGTTLDRSRCSTTKCHSTRLVKNFIDIKVLDEKGPNWLNGWRSNFAALEISHLRSPMFFHIDPRDRDGLLAFAHETGRYCDCVEIANCVQKSMSKNRRKKKIAKGHTVGSSDKSVLEIDERDRKDYFTPSAELFQDYCDNVIHNYSLEDQVEQSQVVSIDFGFFDDVNCEANESLRQRVFKLFSGCGKTTYAKTVVLAIGAGGAPAMPLKLSAIEKAGACHSSQLPMQPFLGGIVRQKLLARKSTTLVVVGGGLTAAQLADKCVQEGVSRVYMIMRSALKLKPFDVDLEWMGKYKNVEKAAFWSADSDEERLEILLKARNGGSIPPRFYKKLQAHIARGVLSIHPNTVITSQIWDPARKTWTLDTKPMVSDIPSQVDYIFYATGARPDVEHIPFLSPLREKIPIKTIGGMPCLTDDLTWAQDVPLFVSGRLAGLRIGPDCGNLEGARIGAERISWALAEILEVQQSKGKNNEEHLQTPESRVGIVNRYECLEPLE